MEWEAHLVLMAEHLYLMQVSCALKAQHELLGPLTESAYAYTLSTCFDEVAQQGGLRKCPEEIT